MEQQINEILALLHEMNRDIMTKLETIESRLARLEKVDSIEHRVSVNQIDLSDIKEILERIEESGQCTTTTNHEPELESTSEFVARINKRLDSHLLRIAKVEEELELIKEK
ncbi:hypothetical protein ACNQFZ_14625 [Schinkia sp. CFF1]